MIGKIVIIVGIVVGGAILFLPQTMDLLPESPRILDSIKDDVSNFQSEAKEKVDQTIEKPTEKLSSGINDLKKNSVDLITGAKDTPIIPTSQEEKETQEEIGFYGKLEDAPEQPSTPTTEPSTPTTEPSTVIRNSNGSPKQPTSTGGQNPPSQSSQTPQTSTPFFQTLSLTTKKQTDNSVVLNYVDTSGKTKSVKVTLRNSEKILFEGTFFASKFEAFVFDASNTPHFIDMVVDHEEHGIITSSVYNPAGNTDTTINGVFTKS